ncbi:MAG: hypothetical protein ACRD8Z_20390 [Nitrososphaeraceae archaeon]
MCAQNNNQESLNMFQADRESTNPVSKGSLFILNTSDIMPSIIKQYISRSSATLLPEAIQAQYVNGAAVPGIRKKINHSP